MPQILFQDVHHAKNKSLLIMKQFAIYLDLASNVRRERASQSVGVGFSEDAQIRRQGGRHKISTYRYFGR